MNFLENNMVWGVDSLTKKQRFTLLNIHADQLFVHRFNVPYDNCENKIYFYDCYKHDGGK